MQTCQAEDSLLWYVRHRACSTATNNMSKRQYSHGDKATRNACHQPHVTSIFLVLSVVLWLSNVMPRLGSIRGRRSCRFTLSKFPRPYQMRSSDCQKTCHKPAKTIFETYDQAQCRSHLAHRPIISGVFHAQRTAHLHTRSRPIELCNAGL